MEVGGLSPLSNQEKSKLTIGMNGTRKLCRGARNIGLISMKISRMTSWCCLIFVFMAAAFTTVLSITWVLYPSLSLAIDREATIDVKTENEEYLA